MSLALELIVVAMRQRPFLVLGQRVVQRTLYVRVYLPRAVEVELVGRRGTRLPMRPFSTSGLFEWRGSGDVIGKHPLVAWRDAAGCHHLQRDPYSFDVKALLGGTARGTHAARCDGFGGTCFVARAGDAAAVNVLGAFNGWCPDSHPLGRSAVPGVWALFVPGVRADAGYRFATRTLADLDREHRRHERHARIARAAYLRAERRRFEPGHELEDWLEAEREVDAPAARNNRS